MSGLTGVFPLLAERAARLSLSARLVLIAGLALCALAAAGLLTHATLTAQLAARVIDPQLDAAINDAILRAEAGPEGEFTLRGGFADARFEQLASGRYLQVMRAPEGAPAEVVWRSPSLAPAVMTLPAADIARALGGQDRAGGPNGEQGGYSFTLAQGPGGAPLRVGARAVRLPGLEGRWLIVAGADPTPESVALGRSLGRITTGLVVVCGAVVLMAALLQLWAGVQPLRQLSADVAAVRRGDAEELAGPYPTELAGLAEELNALVRHNREVVERARRHVGNLAHALKTPLAVLRNATSRPEPADAAQVAGLVAEMERFVERQLRRARVAARAEAAAGAQAPTIAYRTPAGANLQDLIDMMEQRYDAKAVDITLVRQAQPTFRGEREDLLEMCANLIDNACKYGRSRVVVTLSAPRPGRMQVTVEDDGPGIDPERLASALERGARLDEAAPGQGLGLSILSETAALYEGELAFDRSPSLGGLRARLILPATD